MTDPSASTPAETVGIILASATWGFVQYLNDHQLLHGLLVALLFGLVGGLGKGLGHYFWVKLSKRYKLDQHEPKKPA